MATRSVARLMLLLALQFVVTYGAQFEGAPDISEALPPKEGTCPEISNEGECLPGSTSGAECVVDSECKGDRKCCSDGCSLKCLKPLKGIKTKNCSVPIDLGFLIDASNSIGIENFGKIQDFVKKIIGAFQVGPSGTHVAAIWYSDDAEVAFDFNALKGDNITKENVFKLVDKISVTEGRTRIDKALKLANTDMFSLKAGMRPARPKMLLVLTDGRQTNEDGVEGLHLASKPLKENGVQVFSLGIGSDFNVGELLDIASDDASVFNARSFNELLSNVATITEQSCKGCTKSIDIHFAVDSSINFSKQDFDLVRDFLDITVNRFVVSRKGAHFSGSVFGDDARMIFNFHQGSTKEDVLLNIRKMPHLQQTESNMDKAARLASAEAFSLKGGLRQGVPKVFLLITAGNCASCKEKLVDAVAPLQDDGVQIITMAIGNKIDVGELQAISSIPEGKIFFQKSSVLDLSSPKVIQELDEAICSNHPGICPIVRRPSSCPPEVQDRCNSDTDCQTHQKCCFDECGKACVGRRLGCIKPLDIAFAIDVSSSSNPVDFKLLTEGTSKMVSDFKVGAANSHVSLVTFSKSARVIFDFGRTYNPNKMRKEITALNQDASKETNIEALLKTANDEVFTLKGRARRGVPKVLVVVSKGPTQVTNVDSITKNAEVLKQALGGVEIINVYIGPKGSSDAKLLESISSKSGSSREKFFQFNSAVEFTEYKNLLNISSFACSAVYPKQCPVFNSPNICMGKEDKCGQNFDCPGNHVCCSDGCTLSCIPKEVSCTDRVDVLLALDDSIKVGEKNFLKVRNFAKNLLASFNLGKDDVRVAAMSYSNSASMAFDFADTAGKSLSEIQDNVQAIAYTGGSTSRLDRALGLATSQLLLQSRSGPGIKKTLILFTDGNTDVNSGRLDTASWGLRARNARIVAVSVGNNINEKQLENVVSLPLSNSVFLAANYDDLQKNINEITKVSCQAAQLTPERPIKLVPGPAGDPGPKGDPGTPGPKGDKGNKGLPGAGGGSGGRGRPGAKGDPGAAGPAGPAGGITKGPDPLYSAVGILSDQSGVNPEFAYVSGAEGPQGSPGKAGPVGASGDKGEGGDIGPKGEFGRIGPYGPQGPRGNDGKNGKRGPIGARGDQGLSGPVGPEGSPGRAGPQGPFGWKGARGAVGEAGDQGDAGVAGLKGYAGEKGSQGEVGQTGTVGAEGEEGPTGPQGQRGPRGKQGVAGKQGIAGEEGFTGSTGLPGLTGPKGASGPSGLRGPKGQPGEEGLPGLQGPRGASGDAGAAGKEGAAGPKGTPGATGPTGAQGLTGPEGPQGPQGPQGLLGPEGPKGDNGQRGQRGVAGRKGDEGEGGLRGAPGPQGADGPQGATGATGQRGPAGPTGETGQRGRDGDPGRNGVQGIKGEPGAMGNVGKSGQKGTRGLPGVIGDQGSAGPIGQAGAPGQAGKDGKQGPSGPNGKDGLRGSPGAVGQQGFPGPVGPPGAVGDAGSQGLRGADGKNGRKGVTGEAGPMGETGSQGPQGETGAVGEAGPQGAPGVSGFQGPPGPTGGEGAPGKDGSKGPKGSPGKDGPPGPQGERGPMGLRGPSGLQGRQGAPGEEGDQGEAGPRGERGADGPLGEQGAQGSTGPIGQPGNPGRRGVKGPNGLKGPKGESGGDGLPGSPGMQGISGRPGAPGQRGERGADGPNGAAGLDGIVGEPGETGPTGLPGRNGAQGLPGPSGPPGDRGPKGPSGDPGEKGAAGRPGAIGPVGPIGRRGHKGSRGTVGDMGEMGEKGPQGPIGPSGPPGATGPSGPPGPSGPSGKDGKRGPRGDTGEPGERGPQGKEGDSGKDGAPGNPGKPGKAGTVGAQGARGPNGNRGPAGLIGRSGFTGQPGPTGAKGYPGLNGRDGTNGKQGPQGRTGPQGSAGAIGDPGSAGLDGPSGTAGLPGNDGASGAKGSRGAPGKSGASGAEGVAGSAGPQGSSGEKGYTGKPGKEGRPGKKGDQGAMGDRGNSGSAGAEGNAGRKGLKGNQGATGIPGEAGDVGEKGNKGYTGVAGPPGLSGARGTEGVPGAKGFQGRPGASGLDGSKGNDGEYGDSGEHGKPGNPGPQGPTGPEGPPGEMMTMSGQFAGYLTAGGLQKGPAHGGYYNYGYNQYSGNSGTAEDKVAEKGVKSFNDYLEMLKQIEETNSFTGTQNDPARTCKDLFMRYPNKESGDYWIDPNEGSSVDKVLVHCSKNTSETCIYPKHPSVEKDQWLNGGDKYRWAMQHLMGELEGVLYAAEMRQMKVMKLFSTRARQTVKYFCKNSHAWKKATGKVIHKTVKFLTDNEKEIHGHSYDAEMTPEVEDGCKIKDGKWHETVFKFDTKNLNALPILDIAAHDIGDSNERFGLEIGPVCFS